jgi:hypothetical protein
MHLHNRIIFVRKPPIGCQINQEVTLASIGHFTHPAGSFVIIAACDV